ncbi:galectin-12 isoform 4-T4 [Hipposideros larvatus]
MPTCSTTPACEDPGGLRGQPGKPQTIPGPQGASLWLPSVKTSRMLQSQRSYLVGWLASVVPYVTTIFGGLRAGKMVMLQGVVPLKARRFQVDFQCGCSLHPRPDIAIHFNPRFHTTKPHVICNTLHNGLWQAEARWPHLALQRGASFLILFLFGNEEMKVSVNGQHFLHYRYRLPLSRVDTLGIFGDILVKAVGFLNINPFSEGGSEYPVGYPFLLKSPRLEVPCLRPLPRGLWPGQVIVLRGLVLPEPKESPLRPQEKPLKDTG